MKQKLRKELEEWPNKTRPIRLEINRKRGTSTAPVVLTEEEKRKLGIRKGKK